MMRYKPMLAYPVSDKPINYDEKVFMQPKLDGVRCLIQDDKLEMTEEEEALGNAAKYTPYY